MLKGRSTGTTSPRVGAAKTRTRVLAGSILTVAMVIPALFAPGATVSVHADEPVETVIAAAGDIACRPGASRSTTRCQQAATAQLIGTINPDYVLALGDNQYDTGTYSEFTGSGAYGATWGTFLNKTLPVPGNHEYDSSGAAGYYKYFGEIAGDRTKGYYSRDVGSWHIVALNSECSAVGGCHTGSPQEQWLRADLAASTAPCTLAFWHHPRFSSASSSSSVLPLYRALYDANAELALVGHAHFYERFAPQTHNGVLDTARGIRQIVVGVGGKSFHSFGTAPANSEVRNNNTFGVLKLTLKAGSYDWQFMHAAIQGGGTFTDEGSGTCHGPGPDTTPPSTPADLSVTGSGSTQVSLAWSASTDNVSVTGYRVYRNENDLPIATTGTTPSYTDATVSPGATYSYQVSAIDAAANESPRSDTVTVTTQVTGGTFTFVPSDDAYVRESEPNRTLNYAQVTVDNSPVDNFLVKFNVSTPCTTVTDARLRLTNSNGSSNGGSIRKAEQDPEEDPWRESTVTWNTAPEGGATVLASWGTVSPGITYTANVTSAVTANGSVSFRASSTSSNGARYYSKEGSATQGPRLVVTCS